ncbi:transcription antitermination factor NusB [Syntrophomonas palmitatica]|uniref:transcription antitermination factor NusB n=1 Tax=Syntrophomonas palmitatica TaxID=402877 RepID=UPI0006D2C516|nr:transcription antitermination factor NusB [Syntrophomonas palmitatica]
MSRRKARELAFKVLFQVDQVDADPKQAFDYLLHESELMEKDHSFSWELTEGTLEHQADIDRRISSYARDWAINRMPSVDRNIMRVAAFEILYMENSQPVVAIDEAVEMAKKYGDENSPAFINAILDRLLGE